MDNDSQAMTPGLRAALFGDSRNNSVSSLGFGLSAPELQLESFSAQPADAAQHPGQPQLPLFDLHNAMFACFNKLMNRMNAIEQQVSEIHGFMSNRELLGRDVAQTVQDVVASEPPADDPASKPPVAEPAKTEPVSLPDNGPRFRISVEGVEQKWYTERAFPPFSIRVTDLRTGEVVHKANDWRVQIHLYDGFGRQVDNKLEDDKTKTQYLIEGTAEVSGLRFKQVSSKNGGFFNIECEVLSPDHVRTLVVPERSENIVVMSCRLYSCRKGSLSKLDGMDPVEKMPGIGRLYAERLSAAGVSTIKALSELPLDDAGHARRHDLLEAIRKDKGTMTEAKLLDYIRKARSIVSGELNARRKRVAEAAELPLDVAYGLPVAKRHCGDHDIIEELQQKVVDVGSDVCENFLNMDDELSPPPNALPEDGLSPFHELGGCDSNLLSHELGVCRNVDVLPAPGAQGLGAAPSVASPAMRSPASPSLANQFAAPFPLHTAVALGRLDVCEKMVATLRKQHRVLDQFNVQQLTPLMVACVLGKRDLVQYLLGLREINPDKTNLNDMSALHFAVASNQLGCVVELLNHKPAVRVNAKTASGWTPLMMACGQGYSGVAHELLRHVPKDDAVASRTTNGLSLFHLAALSGSVPLFAQLVATLGADAAVRADDEEVPVPEGGERAAADVPSIAHCAAYAQSSELLKSVLALPNLSAAKRCGDKGYTPLHIAACRGPPHSVCLLATHPGVDVDARCKDGWTPLTFASMESGGEADSGACVRALLAAGAMDSGSEVPASMVSVVCANMDALAALASKRVPRARLAHNNKAVEVDVVSLGRALGDNGDVEYVVGSAQQAANQGEGEGESEPNKPQRS